MIIKLLHRNSLCSYSANGIPLGENVQLRFPGRNSRAHLNEYLNTRSLTLAAPHQIPKFSDFPLNVLTRPFQMFDDIRLVFSLWHPT